MALIMLFTMVMTSACSIKDHQVYFADRVSKKEIFKIGSYACPVSEFKLYILNYKNIYTSIGDNDIWTEEFDTDKEAESIKKAALNYLTKVYALYIYANENEITLDDAQIAECQKAADNYYDSLSKPEKKFIGAKQKDIREFCERYALAYIVNQQLVGSVDDEVSEDEARIMEAIVLFTSDISVAKTVQDKIDYGNTFERLAGTYTELDTFKVTFGRGEYDKSIDDVVFNLDDGQISSAIEADGGYYFFQCTNKYNEALSDENKKVIVANRQKKAVLDITNDISERMYSDINEKVYENISFDNTDECNTDSFFITIENVIVDDN